MSILAMRRGETGIDLYQKVEYVPEFVNRVQLRLAEGDAIINNMGKTLGNKNFIALGDMTFLYRDDMSYVLVHFDYNDDTEYWISSWLNNLMSIEGNNRYGISELLRLHRERNTAV